MIFYGFDEKDCSVIDVKYYMKLPRITETTLNPFEKIIYRETVGDVNILEIEYWDGHYSRIYNGDLYNVERGLKRGINVKTRRELNRKR